MLTMHKTFDREGDGKRSVVWYVAGSETVARITPKEWPDFVADIKTGTVLRITAVNASDAQLIDLAENGAKIMYAHWHSLGIEKNLEPEKIVAAVAAAPESLFRAFTPRRDIAELRTALDLRNAISRFYGDSVRRFKQVGRNLAIVEGAEDDPLLEQSFYELGIVKKLFTAENEKGKRVSLDKRVEELAKRIPECVLFNKIAGIKGSYISAASVVAYSGGIERFPAVASFWHYFGQNVVDGKAPKRAKGAPMDWNPKGRTTVYLLGDSLIKNRNNPWRPFFEEARSDEVAVHAEKHPNCPSPDGHCTARAKRKMCKEILKRFYLAANGKEYNSHQGFVNRDVNAAA